MPNPNDYGPTKVTFKDINSQYYQDPEDVDPVTQPINRHEPVINYTSRQT